MANKNQEEIVFNIIKHNPAQRTDQVKIKAMQAGVSCADRYLRWLQERGFVHSYKTDKDRTKTWTWTGKPYFIAKKNNPKTVVEESGQRAFQMAAVCFFLSVYFLFSLSLASAQEFASGKNMTKYFEGYRPTVYLCPGGARTIGYGFNLLGEDVRRLIPEDVLSGKAALEKHEAEHVFDVLYKKARNDAINFVGQQNFRRLTPMQKDILTDMAYNLGRHKLAGFHKLRRAIIQGNGRLAANEMKHSLWYRQTGRRARHHVNNFGDVN